MSEGLLAFVKIATAIAAAVVCYRIARAPTSRERLLLLPLAVLAICAYFRFGRLPAGFVHRWEMFHYYVGAKYHSELGYKRLYRCAALADFEDAALPRSRAIRNLDDDGTESARGRLSDLASCRAHFSDERWSAFRHDIRFFRRALGRNAWAQAQLDHGYNPPPLWTASWGKLSELVPVSFRNLQLLAAIDVALMFGVLFVLGWGFGWRVAALGAIFWGTQAASEIGWTGGGFARQDWLFLCVAGVAALRRRRYGLAGAALSLAALLRVFPALLLAGAALALLAVALRERALPRGAARFAIGAALALSVGCAVSVARCGNGDAKAFWSHIQLRHRAIVSNHMGLRTVVAAAAVTKPVRARAQRVPAWILERRDRLERFANLYGILALAALSLVAAAAWQARAAWVGAALATLAIPLVLEPSNYYYSFFLVLVPLSVRKRTLGVLLCVLAAGGQLLSLQFSISEARFAALSCLYVAVLLIVASVFARWPRETFSLKRAWT